MRNNAHTQAANNTLKRKMASSTPRLPGYISLNHVYSTTHKIHTLKIAHVTGPEHFFYAEDQINEMKPHLTNELTISI